MFARRALRAPLLITAALLLCGGCKGKGWVLGSWLFVDDNGKPGTCFTFAKKGKLTVYKGAECKGPIDKMASGKWQLKEETKLAILRGEEKVARLAMITSRKDDHFVSRGTLPGTLYRVGKEGAAALLQKLKSKGVIKVFPLPKKLGCSHLDLAQTKIRALPKEKNPRMLRARDQGLEYRVVTNTGDPQVKKVVYALNQDQLDWVYVELTEAAFAAPGPEGRLEAAIGKPTSQISTGKGQKRQNVLMWKTYCAELHGQRNQDIDLTLFSTAGEKSAYYYLSEGVVSNIWENLKQMAADPAAQDNGDEDGDGDKKDGDKKDGDKKDGDKKDGHKAAAKKAAPVKKAPAKPAPVKKAPAKPAPVKKAAKPAVKTPPAKAKGKGGVTSGGRPVVSGSDEDI